MFNRRQFVSLAAAQSLACMTVGNASAQVAPASSKLQVELPRNRVPMSFIIDDSTCLVNMGKFCMPQFATARPEREEYKKPWREWPSEIPDDFVRQFGSWCAEHGVKGKYSVVPYPACVGWLDRELPGWSRQQLQESLKLVRELMVPNWDIHPEMITHTRVIDLKSGRPMPEINAGTMENSFPQEEVSVDFLASYLAYALRILKNCDLPCEGITTPGGFGNRVKDQLPIAVHQAVRDVYGCELPHYFKYVSLGEQSVLPKLENLRDADTDQPTVTMNVPAGTGDWFGGWDGVDEPQGHLYSNRDATGGRMVELIEKRQPAIMLCHWPGLYCNGSLKGFHQFQDVVTALEQRFGEQTIWMKVSQIGRYWAAKELTRMQVAEGGVQMQAPFACDDFTLTILDSRKQPSRVVLNSGPRSQELVMASSPASLTANTYTVIDGKIMCCFSLPKGASRLEIAQT